MDNIKLKGYSALVMTMAITNAVACIHGKGLNQLQYMHNSNQMLHTLY